MIVACCCGTDGGPVDPPPSACAPCSAWCPQGPVLQAFSITANWNIRGANGDGTGGVIYQGQAAFPTAKLRARYDLVRTSHAQQPCSYSASNVLGIALVPAVGRVAVSGTVSLEMCHSGQVITTGLLRATAWLRFVAPTSPIIVGLVSPYDDPDCPDPQQEHDLHSWCTWRGDAGIGVSAFGGQVSLGASDAWTTPHFATHRPWNGDCGKLPPEWPTPHEVDLHLVAHAHERRTGNSKLRCCDGSPIIPCWSTINYQPFVGYVGCGGACVADCDPAVEWEHGYGGVFV